MSAQHNGHQPEQVARRQPQAGTIIAGLNRRLDDKANEIRRLEDSAVYLQALVDDVEAENAQLLNAVSQMRAENLILRRRLDLGETEPVELTDAEVDSIGDTAHVVGVPEPGDQPG